MPGNADIGQAAAVAIGAALLFEFNRQKKPALISKAQQTGEHKTALGAFPATLPCNVQRRPGEVRTAGGKGVGEDCIREFAIQKASYVAQFGSVLGTPPITNRCAFQLANLWLDVWAKARKQELGEGKKTTEWRWAVLPMPEGLNIFPLDVAQTLFLNQACLDHGSIDRDEVNDLKFRTATNLSASLGRAWCELVDVRNSARAQSIILPDRNFDEVSRFWNALKAFATRLDGAGIALPSASSEAFDEIPKYVADSAQSFGEKFGNIVSGTVRVVLAPVIGATAGAAAGIAVSELAPLLLVGGAAFLAWRKLT